MVDSWYRCFGISSMVCIAFANNLHPRHMVAPLFHSLPATMRALIMARTDRRTVAVLVIEALAIRLSKTYVV